MICPYCLKTYESQSKYCPNCGRDWLHKLEETRLLVGSVIGNQSKSYIIEGVKGQDGFGITYVALDKEENKKVAIREYFPIRCASRNPDGSVSPILGQENGFSKGLDSFYREGSRRTHAVSLETIANIWDEVQANNTIYFVMDFCDGMTLRQKALELGGHIPSQDLLSKIKLLMDDIEQLHRQRMLHGDINPDNILWMEDGSLKLVNFGFPCVMENDRSMTVMLNSGFASPEQYLTPEWGPWTDVYGLAATIYYCLSGIVASPATERLGKDNYSFELLTSYGVNISFNKDSAIWLAMLPQPVDRIKSMREFSLALFEGKFPEPEIPPMPCLYGCPTAKELPGLVPECMLVSFEGYEIYEL